MYRAGTNALEALDATRRLYESGLVDWAIPGWITPMDDITARPQDEQFQAGKQWNLEMIGLPSAWDITKGEAENGRPSLIAIIDTGVQQKTRYVLCLKSLRSSIANNLSNNLRLHRLRKCKTR